MNIKEKVDRIIELLVEKKNKLEWDLTFQHVSGSSESWMLAGRGDGFPVVKIDLLVHILDAAIYKGSIFSMSILSYSIPLDKASPEIVDKFIFVINEIFSEKKGMGMSKEIEKYQKIIDVFEQL